MLDSIECLYSSQNGFRTSVAIKEWWYAHTYARTATTSEVFKAAMLNSRKVTMNEISSLSCDTFLLVTDAFSLPGLYLWQWK